MHHHAPHHSHHAAKPVKKAAAALSVGVGSLSDPWDLQVGGFWRVLQLVGWLGGGRTAGAPAGRACTWAAPPALRLKTVQGGPRQAPEASSCTTTHPGSPVPCGRG